MKISYALAAYLCAGMAAHAQESPLWKEFVASRASGRTATLPDFSWAGYHFSEKELPDGQSKKVFNVKDFGALPDDDRYDDDAIQLAVRAAEANPGGGIVFFPAGRYLICPDEDQSKRITIRKSGIVLRGSG
ncbi:glycosyl hydrolase family 28-related protein, partial [Chitinophaga sp.]|uniref:glycosyl hydrolase family 28-related protein n=1 Tax=Chitinophaga sp. TaxID=1869181 RepID=UPI002631A39D